MRCLILICSPFLVIAVPRFDPTSLLRDVLVPADAALDSIIYRLRASDPTFDYPLVFSLRGESTTVYVESLNCTRFNSVCQANVIVRKKLEPGRFYDFTVVVTNNNRGESAFMNCSFRATNATTPIAKIFPGAPTLLSVSEKSRRNTEIGTVIARGSSAKMKPVLLELWGSPQFGLRQRVINERDAEGTVWLLSPLDYEKQTVHHLKILANDPWSELDKDTRNIATWSLLVAVLDEQDTPPVFTLAPPTTTLNRNLKPGDLILQVHAEDGDREQPREVRYGLVSEGSPFTTFFDMSEESGELRLAKPLSDIQALSHSGQPILLTVIAEEVRDNPQESPAQFSTVQLALILPEFTAGSPIFGADEYSTLLEENSPTGTVLSLAQANIATQPGDVVTLELVNNNGTFDITPNVVEGQKSFQIKVRDPKLLDYEERKSVECYIVAKEVGVGNFTAKAKLTVLLKDVNDNPPKFSQSEFEGSIPEGAKVGNTVLLVEANDIDKEPGSKIRFTKLSGTGSEYFHLDSDTGIITVSNSQGLDAEVTPVFHLMVEAADENGLGHTTTSKITIKLIDINDVPPVFEKKLYEFILNPQKTGFTTNAFIKAVDKDVSPPNNEVHYELINQIDNLKIDEYSGELSLIKPWTRRDIAILTARAWDGGIPRLSDECEIKIYPPEGQSRQLLFIVPGRDPDRSEVRKTIQAITGGRVSIDEVRPYSGYEPGATDISQDTDTERSVVLATITYSKDSIIDIDRIHEILDKDHRVRKPAEIRESSSINLLWLLILLIILALLAIIILILCCICERCPLYVPPKKRQVHSSEIRSQKMVIKDIGQGQESKSVQVAEWFGRKEAWTPDRALGDSEVDSLRRHELDRGSDKIGVRRTVQRQQQVPEPSRDQLYIREGNADILRLVTRGGEQQRPVTLVGDQQYIGESGKDILMRRFMEQQQAEVARSQVLLPNAVSRLQAEHELLEASLRQQNALLRQILIERERDLRLETQSLPAGTQTDQDAGTQTEPHLLRPPRRRVQSDNDATDYSDDEIASIKAKVRKRHVRGSQRTSVRRKIKTPIQEESEIEVVEKPHKMQSASTETKPQIRQTRTSELRQKKASTESKSRSQSSKSSSINKEVLKEISASLDHSDNSLTEEEYYKGKEGYYSEDSLEEISPRSEIVSSGKQKYHSETDLATITQSAKSPPKSQSHTDLSKLSNQPAKIPKATTNKPKRVARYMEWYKKKDAPAKNKKETDVKKIDKEEHLAKETVVKLSQRLQKDTESSSRKKQQPKKKTVGPDHPLLQHSEHRYEAPYAVIRRPEDDVDSGIALARPPMAQKKSVFAIAYNDMHTSQLRPDSTTPP